MFSALGDQEKESEPSQETHDGDTSRFENIEAWSVGVRDQDSTPLSQTWDIGPRNDGQAEPILPPSTSNATDFQPDHSSTQAKFQEGPEAASPVAQPQRINNVQRQIPMILPKTRWPRERESLRLIMQRRRTEAKIDEWWTNNRWMEEGFEEEESPCGMIVQEIEIGHVQHGEQSAKSTESTEERQATHDSDDKMTEHDEFCGAVY